MTEHLYVLTIIAPMITVLCIAALRYVSRIQQARARLADEGAYREVAERAATAEAETASALQSIQAALSDVRARLVSVETILKDVG